MHFDTELQENGKWFLYHTLNENITYYTDKHGEIYFFDTEKEALEHLETFEVKTFYSERLNTRDKPLSGQALKEATLKRFDEIRNNLNDK